jgi:hypothetical protein
VFAEAHRYWNAILPRMLEAIAPNNGMQADGRRPRLMPSVRLSR